MWALVVTVGLACGALVAFAVPGEVAAAPSGPAPSLPENCMVATGTATCSFGFAGSPQAFVVPAGISSITVAADGAQGGAASSGVTGVPGAAGGDGGVQTGTLTVNGGDTLEVYVGGQGGDDGNEVGGYNGGGGGTRTAIDGTVAGGGGGGSDVRTSPFTLTNRVVVAGGGGGGGGSGGNAAVFGGEGSNVGGPPGGAGGAGAASAAGGNASVPPDWMSSGGAGGGSGGTSAGSPGGAGTAGSLNGDAGNVGTSGGIGSLAQGGSGGTGALEYMGDDGPGGDGGGGGGGYYGGGGGGGGVSDDTVTNGTGGGGGGGGSSYVLPGAASPTSTSGVQTGNGEVAISFAVTAPQITSAASSTFRPDQADRVTVTATGAPTSVLSETGALPAGVTFTANGDGSATISGTPTAGETGNYQLSVTAANGVAPDATQSFVLTVGLTNTGPPSITGTAGAGDTLRCTPGSWTGSPTFSYQWNRDGTPIQGATGSAYVVQTLDEGNVLTCSVTAVDAGGSGSATSNGIHIPVPHAAGCPAATGTLAGTHLGLIRLGMTRRQARRAYRHSSTRGRTYVDFFCLTPIGIRAGYGSPKLLAPLATARRATYAGRIVWISTSSAFFAIDGVRRGATIAATRARLKLTKVFVIGANDWYLAPLASATAVLKVRDGTVQEIGIADRSLTKTRPAQRLFLTSFS